MEPSIFIPTPKTPSRRKESTRDERLRIQTLYFDAGWTQAQIALQLNLTRDQVRYALQHRITPQKTRSGCKPLLNTPQRKRLIEWVTSSSNNRQVPWPEIPALLGWDCGVKAIRAAFKKEGYTRACARQKPPLTYANQISRLCWAIEHEDWTEEQWFSLLWTDETWVKPGRHTRLRITPKIGPSELYHPDCIAPRHQRKIGWMFWGSISGKYGRHKGLFWEKDWETINGVLTLALLSLLYHRFYKSSLILSSNKIMLRDTLLLLHNLFSLLLELSQSFGQQIRLI